MSGQAGRHYVLQRTGNLVQRGPISRTAAGCQGDRIVQVQHVDVGPAQPLQARLERRPHGK